MKVATAQNKEMTDKTDTPTDQFTLYEEDTIRALTRLTAAKKRRWDKPTATRVKRKLFRKLTKKANLLIARDRKRRLEETGQEIEDLLATNPKLAYGKLQRFYRSKKTPNDPRTVEDMATTSEEYAELYNKHTTTDTPFVTYLDTPFNIPDEPPSIQEITAAVKGLKTGSAPGPTGITAYNLKTWAAAHT